eukprot:CAMPEP_0181180524 /NCGR_PEP_ID=MMETSP1096-20121128/6848_1 /TAXON_ID=156174 ORGANISM="Chrysochromulina ericina, Strain CCMP281" /NCGR_SAMPLE_ID=MMETSP1096 /ASSEMBLY_ACC=CAM_ASM_000453 /LENGTH=151 /DNA_ID=CAMNT_0023268963 /DNA_START=655 /DNA_END=1107 /DNA_ORIENTATION=+
MTAEPHRWQSIHVVVVAGDARAIHFRLPLVHTHVGGAVVGRKLGQHTPHLRLHQRLEVLLLDLDANRAGVDEADRRLGPLKHLEPGKGGSTEVPTRHDIRFPAVVLPIEVQEVQQVALLHQERFAAEIEHHVFTPHVILLPEALRPDELAV